VTGKALALRAAPRAWQVGVTMKMAEARSAALALPESVELPHHASTSFRVRGKIYATAPPGDEYLHLFVGENLRELAIAMHPGWAAPLYWGGRVRGLKVTLAGADRRKVGELLWEAWRDKAPATLAATLPAPPGPRRVASQRG